MAWTLDQSPSCGLRSQSAWMILISSRMLRDMKGSPRSKNNARQVLGAFYKYAKERGWVTRDHDVVELVDQDGAAGIGVVLMADRTGGFGGLGIWGANAVS